MNHSIYSADRMTHLKIVVVALVAGILVAGFSISAFEPLALLPSGCTIASSIFANNLAPRLSKKPHSYMPVYFRKRIPSGSSSLSKT